VVERPKQEDRVEGAVVELERECIPARDLESPASLLPSLLDVQRHGVDEVDRVALRRKPRCVHAWAAPNVEDAGVRPKVASEDLLRPGELEHARSNLEPTHLEALRIEGKHLGRCSPRRAAGLVHGARICAAESPWNEREST
jgi:hypothetical protein